MPRYAARVDQNHSEMKDHFERLGCKVADAARLGGGFPDFVVSLHKQTVLVEIKSKDGKLSPEQERFHREWKGEIYEARTLDDVIAIVAAMKKRMRLYGN